MADPSTVAPLLIKKFVHPLDTFTPAPATITRARKKARFIFSIMFNIGFILKFPQI
jgi:hypothetical protein